MTVFSWNAVWKDIESQSTVGPHLSKHHVHRAICMLFRTGANGMVDGVI